MNRRPRECHSRALPTALQPHVDWLGNRRKSLRNSGDATTAFPQQSRKWDWVGSPAFVPTEPRRTKRTGDAPSRFKAMGWCPGRHSGIFLPSASITSERFDEERRNLTMWLTVSSRIFFLFGMIVWLSSPAVADEFYFAGDVLLESHLDVMTDRPACKVSAQGSSISIAITQASEASVWVRSSAVASSPSPQLRIGTGLPVNLVGMPSPGLMGVPATHARDFVKALTVVREF